MAFPYTGPGRLLRRRVRGTVARRSRCLNAALMSYNIIARD